jgi:hypothetical protein
MKRLLSIYGSGGFGSPALRSALEHVSVVKQPVQHGTHGSNVAEQFVLVLDRSVRNQQPAAPFVPTHDDLEQIFCGRLRSLRMRKSSMPCTITDWPIA